MQQKSEIETLMPNVKLADFANFFYTFQGVNHPDYKVSHYWIKA